MRVRVLGRVSVVVDGEEALLAPRPRLILAVLASRHGQVVDEALLAELIWGDAQPASARTALQTYVGCVRDALEPGRPRRSAGRFVRTDGTGYALVDDPELVDLARLEHLVEAARRLHGDDPAGAIELLDRALALWADPPLGEFAGEPWATGVVTRLRDLHAAALESRFGLALDVGEEAAVADAMDRAVETYPYRERLAGQRMVALYRRGHQSRALEQYQRTRRHLLDDLGLEPGRELQLLERAILSHDPALRRRNPGQAAVTARPRPCQPLTPLVGRASELASVMERLGSERCVSIVGPSGIGKSALAARVVESCSDRFDGRVHVVDLADHVGRDVIRVVAESMRVVEHPLASLVDSIVDSVDGQPTLLAIETCEVALDQVSVAVASLLAAPGLRVLVTSQAPLGIRAEDVVRLRPLAPDDAIELLLGGRSSRDADRPILAAIVEQLDAVPLSLELASSRLDVLGARELLRCLRADTVLLVGGVDRPRRHRTARAAAEWSLGLLGRQDAEVLARLGAFSAPFTIDAARALTDLDGELAVVLSELVERSLVHRVDGPAVRFRLLESVRRAIADATGESEPTAAVDRVTDLVTCAAQSRVFGQPVDVELDALAGEIVPTLRRLADRGDPRQLLLATLLGSFFIERGRLGEGREQLADALDRQPAAPASLRLLASSQLGFITWYQGDLAMTRAGLREAVGLLGDETAPSLAAAVRGCLAFVEHRFDPAADELTAAADGMVGPTRHRLMMLHLAGNACWYAGRHDEALRHYRAQHDDAAALGDDFHRAQALRFGAMVTGQQGDPEQAWRWAERSLSMAHTMSDPVSLAQASAAVASLASLSGAHDLAVDHAVRAVEAARRNFDVFALRTALPILVEAATREGELRRAARLAGWYVDLLERSGHAPSPAVRHLDHVIDVLREQLGATAFRTESGSGAALGLSGLLAEIAGRRVAA